MPLEAFPVKVNYHNVRSRICRECSKLGHSCTRVEKPKRERRVFASDEERQAHIKEYQRQWREAHREEQKEKRRLKGTRVCIECGQNLPLDAFNDKTGRRNRSHVCRECREKRDAVKAEKPKRGRRPNFKSEEERREQRRAYIKRWKQEHAEKVSAYNKKYLKERREAKKAVKAEPRKVEVKVIKEEKLLRVADIPTPRPQVVSRPGCEGCTKYPCFKGMENTETDFAKEGCHHYTTI